MKKILSIALILTSLVFVGCGNDSSTKVQDRVKGGELLVNFSKEKMKENLLEAGAVDENTTVYGYKAYKVPYTSRDEEGNEVKVSGLFVIPTGLPDVVNNSLGLSMVADDHGTILADKKAPSVVAFDTGSPSGSAMIITSIGGFATLKPDYIGFGDSKEHYHPYVLKDSLANSTVDFIRQVKIFAKENNIKLNNQLFLTGYSEGGYASMATLKKIEEEHLTDLKVSMAAPMAGPYPLKKMADYVLQKDSWTFPTLMAYLGYAYAIANEKELNTIFNEPYASNIPKLFNKELNYLEVRPSLTYITKGEEGLYLNSFVSNYFKSDEHWFATEITKNSVHNWNPTTPLRLVQCEGDDLIPYKMAIITESKMKELGASDVLLVPVEKTLGLTKKLGHVACGSLAYGLITKLFAEVRKKTMGY